jgi:hypothetical protein
MKKVARMQRSHRELIFNWFRARGQLSAHRRGPQRDGPCHHETSLRIPHVPRRRRLPEPDFTTDSAEEPDSRAFTGPATRRA